MSERLEITICEVFAAYAGDALERWKLIEGQDLVHRGVGKHEGFGKGRITGVGLGSSQSSILLTVRFADLEPEEAEKRFHKNHICSVIEELKLPPDLEGLEAIRERLERQRREQMRTAELERERQKEAERQREAERADAAHFARLKSKYQVNRDHGGSPSSPLYTILLRLEDGKCLDEKRIEWLEGQRLYAVVAKAHQICAKSTGDPWDIARACRYWRMANKPEEALNITEGFDSSDRKLVSAILTTRGAAFADVSDLPEAETCARAALERDPDSFYPYNLLGRISYRRGNPKQAAQYFAKAIQLGADPRVQKSKIERYLSAAGEVSRREAARYLLERDPERYSWAEYYLK